MEILCKMYLELANVVPNTCLSSRELALTERIASLEKTASEALQECERLRAALKPFADELDGAWGGLALDHEPIENFAGVNIRVGDLRKARACFQSALSNPKPEE